MNANATVQPVLAAVNLTKTFQEPRWLKKPLAKRPALEDVSFELHRGDILGIAGESGSGKSTLARCLTGLERPDRGRVLLDGVEVFALDGERLRRQRRRIQIVFQDPFASLNPRLSVRSAIEEVLQVHHLVDKQGLSARTRELLEVVGLREADADRYPADFSGGQRQRICLARALAASPDVLIADEAVSSLDVSIQAQVVNLLLDLKEELGLAIVFISHDLHLVQQVAPRILVMFAGRVVECLPSGSGLDQARHPYSELLLAALPRLDEGSSLMFPDVGDLGGGFPDEGCPFRPRCVRAADLCAILDPELREIDSEHLVACHRPRKSREMGEQSLIDQGGASSVSHKSSSSER